MFRRGLKIFFARRFLFSGKSHSVINIVSMVSAVAVGIPVAAMVILMSVFNGFETLVSAMYRNFDPEILVRPAVGKVFDVSTIDTAAIAALPEVEAVSAVLDDAALLEYRGSQITATVRGVDGNFFRVIPMEDMIVRGGTELRHGELEQAVVGQGIAYRLGVRTSFYDPLRFYAPRRGHYSPIVPVAAFSSGEAYPAGVFALDAETDGQYVVTTIDFAQRLFDYEGRASALMIALRQGASPVRAMERIAAVAGDDFKVLDRYMQKPSVYRIMVYEKWGIFFIAAMVLLIASFSIVGSLIMLVIDKRRSIATMSALGCTPRFIRRVFLWQGMMISGAGAAGGLAVGVLVCLIQKWLGVVRIPARTFLIESYPVVIEPADLLCIVAVFVAINFFIAKFTVRKAVPKSDLS